MFLRVTQNARDNPDGVFLSVSSSVASPALFIITTSDISSQLAERIKLPLPASPPPLPPPLPEITQGFAPLSGEQ